MGLQISKHKNKKTTSSLINISTSDSLETLNKNCPAIAKFSWIPSKTYNTDNQIGINVGDKLISFGQSNDGYWTNVKSLNSGKRGWVPSNYIQPFDQAKTGLSSEKFYHGSIERSYAEYLLNSGITGSYLVRDSEGSPGHYTISLRHEGEIIHYRIQFNDKDDKYYLDEYAYFNNIPDLIRYHNKAKGSLITPLLYPVNKQNENHEDEYAFLSQDVWEIPRTEIIMKHKLGSGQYGVVYEALWKSMNCNVAVKTIKEGITVREEFLEEARLMKTLRHPNLVQLLGVCTREPPYYIITEFMANGNLLDFLRASLSGGKMLSPYRLLKSAIDVCCGMSYLEQHNFIHRDLAARNCLVGKQNFVVKVADFGLARCLSTEEDTYQAKEGAQFPIKWTAPEGLMYNKFSIKSDVWAFGILLWELATHGGVPYPDVQLNEVLGILEKGERLDCPLGCPPEVYKLMESCWKWNPDERPTFKMLTKQLDLIEKSDSILDDNLQIDHDLVYDQATKYPDLPNPYTDDGNFLLIDQDRDESSRTRFSSSEHIINCDPFDISPPILPLVDDNNTKITRHNSLNSDEILNSITESEEGKRETNSLGRINIAKFAPLPPKRTTPIRQNLTSFNQDNSSQEDILGECLDRKSNLMTSSFILPSHKSSDDQYSDDPQTHQIPLPTSVMSNQNNKSSSYNRPISMFLPKDFRDELKQKLDKKTLNSINHDSSKAQRDEVVSLDESQSLSSFSFPIRRREENRLLVKQKPSLERNLTAATQSQDFKSSIASVNLSASSSMNHKKGVNKRNSWSISSCISNDTNRGSDQSSGFVSKASSNSLSSALSSFSTANGNHNQTPTLPSRLPTLQSLSNNRLDKIGQSNSPVPPNAVMQLLKCIISQINETIKSRSANHDQLILLSDRIDEARLTCLALIEAAECKASAKFQFRDQCTKLSTFLPLSNQANYKDLLLIFDTLLKNITRLFAIRNNGE